jgi:hypothetical protein
VPPPTRHCPACCARLTCRTPGSFPAASTATAAPALRSMQLDSSPSPAQLPAVIRYVSSPAAGCHQVCTPAASCYPVCTAAVSCYPVCSPGSSSCHQVCTPAAICYPACYPATGTSCYPVPMLPNCQLSSGMYSTCQLLSGTYVVQVLAVIRYVPYHTFAVGCH